MSEVLQVLILKMFFETIKKENGFYVSNAFEETIRGGIKLEHKFIIYYIIP